MASPTEIAARTYAAAWNDSTVTSLHVRLKGQSQGDASAIAARWAAELRKTYPVVANSFGHVKAEVLAVFTRTFKVTEVLTWLAAGVAFCGLAGSLLSIKVKSTPNFAKYFAKMRHAPPYKSCVVTTWSP